MILVSLLICTETMSTANIVVRSMIGGIIPGNYMATPYYMNHILNTDQKCFMSVDISIILIIKHIKSLSVCLAIIRTVPISYGLQQSIIMISITHHLSSVIFRNWRGCNTIRLGYYICLV